MPKIDEFAAFDIRIGKIIGVEDHPASRKPMYKLVVHFGSELGSRTIVAGIKDYYMREDLLGKKAVFIVNLEPKMIAGVESQGMLLAAEDSSSVSLLVPDKEIEVGGKIH